MDRRAWVVGLNEGGILGEGWYGRCPDWFGLPFRETFPRATLRLPDLQAGDRLVFLLSSCLALHEDCQGVRIRIGEATWEETLSRPNTGRPWQTISVAIPSNSVEAGQTEVVLETDEWKHGRFEPIQDFREVGILFAGVFRISDYQRARTFLRREKNL